MNPAIRRKFEDNARSVVESFRRAGPFPEQEVTPPLLADAIRQFLDIASRDRAASTLTPKDIDEIGTHALECLSDLALWAYQLGLEPERSAIEDLALDFAQWITRNGGTISVLEPVVNALARSANATQAPEALAALLRVARELAVHTDPRLQNSLEPAGAAEPWRILNFNLAIIATRTQDSRLMNDAYDLLEKNLPQECAAFYEEGLNQAEKPVYGPHVREIFLERAAKWTIRH